MNDLYQRLRRIGFDAKFLKRTVLPDWWEDSLAAVPANRAMAETAIARHLGLELPKLRNSTMELALPSLPTACLKRNKNIQLSDVRPAILVAQHAAELAATNLDDVPPFAGRLSANEVRKQVLKTAPAVDLSSLVDFCWKHGVAVIHLKALPEHTKKIDGMALFCGTTPVIVLASAKDSPPWLAFHLAHELGHILLGHVKQGTGPWVDGSIDAVVEDQSEKEADEFACEVLTGQKRFGFNPTYGMTAPKLAAAAERYSEKHGIAPGVVALFYGRSADRMGPAQLALKKLRQHAGAHEIIDQALMRHLNPDELPESSARFLTILEAASPN
jgi:Zn-dependent peptidase ImmA (M78 family)